MATTNYQQPNNVMDYMTTYQYTGNT